MAIKKADLPNTDEHIGSNKSVGQVITYKGNPIYRCVKIEQNGITPEQIAQLLLDLFTGTDIEAETLKTGLGIAIKCVEIASRKTTI